MKVTSVRVRRIYGKGLYAMVYRKGADFTLRFPNSENAKQNNQFSILAEDSLYKEIKAAVLKQIDSYFYGEKGG